MYSCLDNMKISNIILISFFSILLLFSITTYINYKQSKLIAENNEAFSRSSIILRNSHRFQRNFLYMVSGLRGYLLTDDPFFIQTYDSAILENEKILNELISMVNTASDQRILLDDIKLLQGYWIDEFAMPLLDAKKQATASVSDRDVFDRIYRTKLGSGLEKDVQRSLQKKFSDFTNFEYGFRDSRKEIMTASLRYTENVSFYLTVISVVAGTMIALFIAYYISSRIVKMVTMANAIAAGDYQVHVSEEGNSELSQLGRALNEMAGILDLNISLLKKQKDELDQFAHTVSHDIKGPLRGIDNVVTWIEEDHRFDLPPKVNEYLAIIKGRVARAENLIKGILTYARVGKEEKIREHVNIRELISEVMEYSIPPRLGITLITAPDLPLLYTERLPLLQIFTNLIGNAFRHHDKAVGEVNVYCKSRGDLYEFFVSDDGPGIEVMYHEKIFEMFQTLKEKDAFESTGVGLAIVKKILHDRKLEVHMYSEPGMGSTFSFTWPKSL
ncbi:HAMP domain-containing protein [Chryseolinea soli]|uniref:histidine kinase n=2 Tax=Chryseolinea soli TaxID=2321403 RepID=A0A385SFI3_9BACT|nr:HAMP domain-containing protein [Chryseolinea soli]